MPVINLASLQLLLALFAAVPIAILLSIMIGDFLSKRHHGPSGHA